MSPRKVRASVGRAKRLLGDPFLREWISRFEPDLVLSGHIHNAPFYPEGSWIDRIGKTWVFNPGRQPGPFPTYISPRLRRAGRRMVFLRGRVNPKTRSA